MSFSGSAILIRVYPYWRSSIFATLDFPHPIGPVSPISRGSVMRRTPFQEMNWFVGSFENATLYFNSMTVVPAGKHHNDHATRRVHHRLIDWEPNRVVAGVESRAFGNEVHMHDGAIRSDAALRQFGDHVARFLKRRIAPAIIPAIWSPDVPVAWTAQTIERQPHAADLQTSHTRPLKSTRPGAITVTSSGVSNRPL